MRTIFLVVLLAISIAIATQQFAVQEEGKALWPEWCDSLAAPLGDEACIASLMEEASAGE